MHSSQVTTGKPTLGMHADLLAQVGNAMQAFSEATVSLGVASQVVTLGFFDHLLVHHFDTQPNTVPIPP
jgi:hypothetical protein